MSINSLRTGRASYSQAPVSLSNLALMHLSKAQLLSCILLESAEQVRSFWLAFH
jgi:hypothetical protein